MLHYISDNNTNTTSYGSNHLSFISEQQEQQQSFNDIYSALISEEAEKIYNDLTTKLTNGVIAAAAAIMASSSLPTDNNIQKLTTSNDTHQSEEPRYNNHLEIITMTKSNRMNDYK